MTTKIIATNTVWLGVGYVVTSAISAFSNFLIANMSGPETYGDYVLALTCVGFIATFTDFGISTYGVRGLSRVRESFERKKQKILDSKLYITVGSVIGCTAALWSLSLQRNRVAFTIFIVSIISFCIFDYIRIVLRSKERMREDSTIRVLERVVFLVVAYLGLRYSPVEQALFMIAIAYAVSNTAAAAIAYILLTPVRVNQIAQTRLPTAKKIMLIGLPYMVSGLAWQGYAKLDRLIIANFEGVNFVGQYGAAISIISLIEAGFALYYQAIFPRLCKVYKESSGEHRRIVVESLRIIFLASIAIATLIYIKAGLIVRTLYGEAFVEAIHVLEVLSWALIFSIPMNFFAYIFPSVNDNKIMIKAVVLGVLVSVSVNMVAIPMYSILGAACVYVVTQFIVVSYSFVKYTKIIESEG